MSVIQSIIDGATDSDEPLSNLLRRCLVLAAAVKNDTLRDWCQHELEGYPDRDAVPDYRVRHAQSYGFFVGYTMTMDDQPLPLIHLKKEHREAVEYIHFSQGVRELAAMLEGDPQGQLTLPWNPVLTALYQDKFIDGMSLNRAYIKISKHTVSGVLDTVRNRLLRLALEFDASAGPSDASLSRMPSDEVNRSVVTIIYGGQNVVGSQVGGNIQQADRGAVVAGDFASLKAALRDAGCPNDEIEDLREALDADRNSGSANEIGPQTGGWIGRAATKAWAMSDQVTVAIVVAAITKFLGL